MSQENSNYMSQNKAYESLIDHDVEVFNLSACNQPNENNDNITNETNHMISNSQSISTHTDNTTSSSDKDYNDETEEFHDNINNNNKDSVEFIPLQTNSTKKSQKKKKNRKNNKNRVNDLPEIFTFAGTTIPKSCLQVNDDREFVRILLESNNRKVKKSSLVRIIIEYRQDLFSGRVKKIDKWVSKNSDLFSIFRSYVCFAGEEPKEEVTVNVDDSPFNEKLMEKTLSQLRKVNFSNQSIIKKELAQSHQHHQDGSHQGPRLSFPYHREVSQTEREKIQSRHQSPPKDMVKIRQSLPAFSKREYILDLINEHQITLILGATGCGKTTQVPQYILEDMINEGNQHCGIICTQPRRISAVSIAERVAEERGEKVKDTVGYQIRFENQVSESTRLAFCTHGVLLRRLISDPELKGITHVILDEIHERDCLTDFCMMVLRDLINGRRKDLKLILMSATVDPSGFAKYFGGDTAILEIPGFTYPVEEFHLEDVLEYTNYYFPALDITQRDINEDLEMFALSDAEEVMGFNSDDQDSWGEAFVEDEEYYESLDEEDGLSELIKQAKELKNQADKVYDKEIIDTYYNHQQRRDQFLPGSIRDHHLSSRYDEYTLKYGDKYSSSTIETLSVFSFFGDKHIHFPLIVSLIEKIHTTEEEGGILVFLPKWDAINALLQDLKDHDLSHEWSLHVAHSMVPIKEQKFMFAPPPEGKRKIVLSTNIAETSITINDIVYVIDTGLVNEKGYNPASDISTLRPMLISQANAKQRRGRAGRVRAGKLYRLYTKEKYEELDEYQLPEMQRTSVEELCLMVKGLNLDDPSRFVGSETPILSHLTIEGVLNKALSPPSQKSIQNAIELLTLIGGIDENEDLTILGRILAKLPIHPQLGKMIIIAAMFGCLDSILTISAMLVSKPPFVLIPGREREVEQVKKEFSSGSHSDHLMLLNVFNEWVHLRKKGTSSELYSFCRNNYISKSTMWMIERTRKQLLGLVYEMKLHGDFNRNDSNEELVRSIIGLGLYPNLMSFWAKSKRKGGHIIKMKTATGMSVKLHPSSILGKEKEKNTYNEPFLVYYEMIQNDKGTFIRDASCVEAIPLMVFFGQSDKNSRHTVERLGSFWVKIHHKHLKMVQNLRSEVSTLFNAKLIRPSLRLEREFDSLSQVFSISGLDDQRSTPLPYEPPPGAKFLENETKNGRPAPKNPNKRGGKGRKPKNKYKKKKGGKKWQKHESDTNEFIPLRSKKKDKHKKRFNKQKNKFHQRPLSSPTSSTSSLSSYASFKGKNSLSQPKSSKRAPHPGFDDDMPRKLQKIKKSPSFASASSSETTSSPGSDAIL